MVKIKFTDEKKLGELMLYIAKLSKDDPTFGATKFNKLLFFADFNAYRELGKSITGQEYQKLEHGPAPRSFLIAKDNLVASGRAQWYRTEYGGFPQERLQALGEPDLSLFTHEEIALIDRVIKTYWNQTARSLSSRSHLFIGWELAEMGETIPYEVALVSNRQPTDAEREYGLSLVPLALGQLS